MSANAIRGIRRKKSSLSEVKIAVLGASGVGKSALIVRFLTKRYIGEYDHQTENRYRSEVVVDSDPITFEILDTCPRVEGELPREDIVQWADGFMLVYSIIDRMSFNYARELKHHILATKSPLTGSPPGAPPCPIALVGNKADLIHLRQVTTEEGEALAKETDGGFCEVSASEQVEGVADTFVDLCRDVWTHRRRSKQSLLDRMLGGKSITKPDSTKSK